MRRMFVSAAGAAALASVLGVYLSSPAPAEAFIHEIIAAACRKGGEEVIPPGQIKPGQSEVRALIASGFIESIDDSDPDHVVIHFDPDNPNSKFVSAGFDLVIPTGPDSTLTLSPLVVPDPDFPAHKNCKNLRLPD